ncbi:MAG: cation:proton antiporter [Desulfovibrionales bacterium]
MNLSDLSSLLLCCCGLFFFTAGTVGMLRFPDTLSRLHALTKADNLGLGFIVLGLMLRTSPAGALKLGLIWLVILAASSTSCFLVGRYVLGLDPQHDLPPESS